MLDVIFFCSLLGFYGFSVFASKRSSLFKHLLLSSLTLGADDSRCKLCCRLLAADSFVMLALTQRHLAARALHSAHQHVRHIAAVPVPGFLRVRVQTIGNNHSEMELHSVQWDVAALATHSRHGTKFNLWSLEDNKCAKIEWLTNNVTGWMDSRFHANRNFNNRWNMNINTHNYEFIVTFSHIFLCIYFDMFICLSKWISLVHILNTFLYVIHFFTQFIYSLVSFLSCSAPNASFYDYYFMILWC